MNAIKTWSLFSGGHVIQVVFQS